MSGNKKWEVGQATTSGGFARRSSLLAWTYVGGGNRSGGGSSRGNLRPTVIPEDADQGNSDDKNKRRRTSTTAPDVGGDSLPKNCARAAQKLTRVAENPGRFEEGNAEKLAIVAVDGDTRQNWEMWEPEGLRFDLPFMFSPREVAPPATLLESVQALMDSSLSVMPHSLPGDEKNLMSTALTICRCALKFARADSKNELLFCSTLMAVTRQRYRSHVDGLYRYDEAGAFVLVKTIAAEDVAFLHASLRLSECIMRSLPSNADRKDQFLLSEVRKVAASKNFETASFIDEVLASVSPPRRNQERNWKVDFVTLLVSIRSDLCCAAGMRSATQSYRRWGELPFSQGGGVAFDDVFFRHGQEDPSPSDNCYTGVRIRLGDHGQSEKLNRLRRFLITTFAGTEGLLLITFAKNPKRTLGYGNREIATRAYPTLRVSLLAY